MKIKKRLSRECRAVASRLKKLPGEGRVPEGSLYRADRGNSVRYRLSDRSAGTSRSVYIPQDFAEDVAAWSANWAAVKATLRELGELARADLVSETAGRTGRKTVPAAEPKAGGSASAAGAGARKCPTAKRRSGN